MDRWFYIESREGRRWVFGPRRYWSVVRSGRNGQVIYTSETYTTREARDATVASVQQDTGWAVREEVVTAVD